MSNLYHTLDRDLDWTMAQKTAGEAHAKVKSVVPRRGLDMYRTSSQWYMMITAGTVHEVRTKGNEPGESYNIT